MGRLLEHGSKSKKFPGRGLINYDFLMILIHGCDPHRPGDHDVSLSAWVANLPDALARREILELNLSGQYRSFLFVQQSKEWDLFQDFWIACHWSPRRVKVIVTSRA